MISSTDSGWVVAVSAFTSTNHAKVVILTVNKNSFFIQTQLNRPNQRYSYTTSVTICQCIYFIHTNLYGYTIPFVIRYFTIVQIGPLVWIMLRFGWSQMLLYVENMCAFEFGMARRIMWNRNGACRKCILRARLTHANNTSGEWTDKLGFTCGCGYSCLLIILMIGYILCALLWTLVILVYLCGVPYSGYILCYV